VNKAGATEQKSLGGKKVMKKLKTLSSPPAPITILLALETKEDENENHISPQELQNHD
jgi:hypothetical protein